MDKNIVIGKQALKWNEETVGMCCSGSKISFPFLDEREKPLKTLHLYKCNELRRF